MAADAGTLTVAVVGGRLVLHGVTPASGWTVNDESGIDDLDLSFRRGDDRVDVDVDVEDGRIRVRIRDRRTDEETSTDLDGQRLDNDGDDPDD